MTNKPTEARATLRSQGWFGGDDVNSFVHRAWLRAQGADDDDFDGRPVVGILNTASDATPCNAHMRRLAGDVRAGILRAGGTPLEMPAMSLGEALMKPTAMLYRNLAAMEVEEQLRAYPVDSAVLLSGCDKTTASMLLGAASSGIPCIFLTGGPQLTGRSGFEQLPGATAAWMLDSERRGDEESGGRWQEFESCVARSDGHCGVMGTASTLASVVEALGLTLPGGASIPAADARRRVFSRQVGKVAVEMAGTGRTVDSILTAASLRNAARVVLAVGGSTNALIHMVALARRLGIDFDNHDFDRLSRETPLMANVVPGGEHQMEDFFYAGGIPAVMRELMPILEGEADTVLGQPIEKIFGEVHSVSSDIIRPLDDPISPEGGLAVLTGNLCPDTALIKTSAASPELLRHRGPAVVFEDHVDLMERIHSRDLDVAADSVLVLKNAGPIGGPGMPEWGMLPIPEKLARQGVTDMVRISDARMSGTSYGTCVLHVCPEAAVGGPLAAVRDGDIISLDVSARSLDVELSPETIARRCAETRPPERELRGYPRLFVEHVEQAHLGADFEFSRGTTPADDPLYDPTTY